MGWPVLIVAHLCWAPLLAVACSSPSSACCGCSCCLATADTVWPLQLCWARSDSCWGGCLWYCACWLTTVLPYSGTWATCSCCCCCCCWATAVTVTS
jgi:hypothetical protein